MQAYFLSLLAPLEALGVSYESNPDAITARSQFQVLAQKHWQLQVRVGITLLVAPCGITHCDSQQHRDSSHLQA